MCDTVVVVRPEGVWFAKNSDRDPNEAQGIDWVAAREHSEGSVLRCTWIAVPQARRTNAVVLSRPFWMWGAEIGTNQHGVTIGNEAVFTKARQEPSGLTGMDLVRLALERAESAEEAAEVISSLLRAHGQGGRAGYSHPGFSYHNSFLIADAHGALVLETAGREVALERVKAGARAISNGLTLPALTPQADRLRGRVAACKVRRARVEMLAGQATQVSDLAAVLRDHGHGHDEPHHHPLRGAMAAPCMHYGGLVAGSQTVGSWIAALSDQGAQHWITGTSAPCMSVFRPIDLHVPANLGQPQGTPDAGSLWWRFERLHRRWLVDARGLKSAQAARDRLEHACFADPSDWGRHWREADAWLSDAEQRWLSRPMGADARPLWLRRLWRRVQAEADAGNRLPRRPV